MKDEQKSRALQACRLLIDVFDNSRNGKDCDAVTLLELREAVEIARSVVGKKGRLLA